MSNIYKLLSGKDKLAKTKATMIDAIAAGELRYGTDFDGTYLHAKPGDHTGVARQIGAETTLNKMHDYTDGKTYGSTGRPDIFVQTAMPRAQFVSACEHGANILYPGQDKPVPRIGDVDAMVEFNRVVRELIAVNPLLKGVEIEDHKTLTATLGFTAVINPNNDVKIGKRARLLMEYMEREVINVAKEALALANIPNMKVVSTVTQTNAVVEIIHEDSCKAKAFIFMCEQGILKEASLDVFCGDSNGDRSIMDHVAENGGICLGVGEKAPECSEIVFERPEDLRSFTLDVLDACPTLKANGFSPT